MFPVLKINEGVNAEQKPSIRVFFRINQNRVLQSGVRTTPLSLHYRYGSHTEFNPIYLAARDLFDKPRKFAFCIEGVPLSFPVEAHYSAEGWKVRGWIYSFDEDDFLLNLPKDRVVTEAVLVEGDCAESYRGNNSLARYDLYYSMPKVDSYYDKKSLNTTFDQALQEANNRMKNDAGYTQLRTAITNDALDRVKSLVASGASVNGPKLGDQDNEDPYVRPKKLRPSPLEIALSEGHEEIAEFLLQQGAKRDP